MRFTAIHTERSGHLAAGERQGGANERGIARYQYALGSADSPLGTIGILCSERGLVSLSLPGDEPAWLRIQAARLTAGSWMIRDDGCALVVRTADELTGYFSGARQVFTVPLDARGTAFQRLVWDAVCAVPYGETVTYAEIAVRIGRPGAPRAVGHANGSNRLPIIVPCHRLVGSGGGLTGYAGGLAMKRDLIDHERRFANN